MEIRSTNLSTVVVISPKIFRDPRGFFLESFHADKMAAACLPRTFVQDNHSRSAGGVLRGLHYQIQRPQGKLVGVIRGSIFDVAADIRIGSPTFGKWVGVILDDVKREALWIPPGFAHAFIALSDEADVVYKCTDYYDPGGERGIRWDDPTLSIKWPATNPVTSEKDRRLPFLTTAEDLPSYESLAGI